MSRLRPQISAWKERMSLLLFPTESDGWVAYLRIGLGLQVASFCLSLRSDWNYLFADLINRDLAEKILSLDSPFIPRLGWITALGTRLGLTEEAVLWIGWSCLLLAG